MKSCAKIVLMGMVVWHLLAADVVALLASPFVDAGTLAARCARPIVQLLVAVLLTQAVIAAADVIWFGLRHAWSMRMSRQDITDEQKQTEGDPKIRMRLRILRNCLPASACWPRCPRRLW